MKIRLVHDEMTVIFNYIALAPFIYILSDQMASTSDQAELSHYLDQILGTDLCYHRQNMKQCTEKIQITGSSKANWAQSYQKERGE